MVCLLECMVVWDGKDWPRTPDLIAAAWRGGCVLKEKEQGVGGGESDGG